MILRRLTSYAPDWRVARLAWPCRHRLRSHHQIFVVHAFSAIVHFYRPIFPLTNQCFGFRGPIVPVLRLELQKMPPVRHHPIVADRSFRLQSENLSQLRRARRPNVIVLCSCRFSRKTPIVFRKIFPFQIFVRSLVALDPLATQFLHQAILMHPVVALHAPFRLRRTGCNDANL